MFWANRPYDGFDTARDAFIGLYGAPSLPEAVQNGRCTNSVVHGWAPVGAMQFHMALRPGESRELFFGLGYVENPEDEKFSAPGVINKTRAHAMIGKYRTPAQLDAAMDALHGHWDALLSNYHTETGDEKVDRMVNIWNQYQCMVTFNMSRSASYFESGMGRGMGFRDSCQDLLGFVHIIPERARERILDIAATQFADGSAYHQYQPLTKKGNLAVGSGFNDDPLWLIAGVDAYLRESGDWSILDEVVTFDCDPDNAAPLMEHLRRSFRFTCTHLGPHKLPLIGRADWNDCLNLNCFSAHPGESFQITGPSEGPVAESVFIAGMFVKYGRAYADILRHLALTAEAAAADAAVAEMQTAVLDAGWDGAWFRRAYDAFGAPVGSKDCAEGQIFIEPQGMCVMAGIGKETGEAAQALKSVEDRLDSRFGIVLLQPAYTKYYLNLGEISSYPPGYKENAGIFCHNNPWITCAEAVLGHGARAFETYRKICPAYLEAVSEVHRTEPYVYSQMVAGKDAPTFGEAKNSWLTGTAAWTFVSISQAILGVQPELDGLRIDPCVPDTDAALPRRAVLHYSRKSGRRGARRAGAVCGRRAAGRESNRPRRAGQRCFGARGSGRLRWRFGRILSGARRQARIRPRASRPQMAAGRASGTHSAAGPARSQMEITARSPVTAITGLKRTSGFYRRSGCVRTAFPRAGRASTRTETAGGTRPGSNTMTAW